MQAGVQLLKAHGHFCASEWLPLEGEGISTSKAQSAITVPGLKDIRQEKAHER